jgi:rhodanese-related sulfurtransferase
MKLPPLSEIVSSLWRQCVVDLARHAIRPAAFIVAAALLPAVATAFFHPRRPTWDLDALKKHEVSLATVRSWNDSVLWVDARSRKAYEKKHVPGALRLNEDEWSAMLVPLLDTWQPDKKIVVYCNKQQCQSSHEVAKRLRETGVEPVYVLKGGWKTWLDANK